MKKIFVFAILAVAWPQVSEAAVKKYTHTNSSLGYAIQVDTSWKVTKGKTSDALQYPKNADPEFAIVVQRVDQDGTESNRLYQKKGWPTFIEQYQREQKKLQGDGLTITFSDVQLYRVSGHNAASLTLNYKIDGETEKIYLYFVSRDPHTIFLFTASGDKKYLPALESIVNSIRIDAPTTTVFTNRSQGYSLRYPAWWFNLPQIDVDTTTGKFSKYMLFSEISRANVVKYAQYDIQVKRIDKSLFWSRPQRQALQQGWKPFLTEFIKVYDQRNQYTKCSDGYVQDDCTNVTTRSAPVQYYVKGYTASIFYTTEKVKAPTLTFEGAPIRRVVVVMTKNMRDVFMIVGSYRGQAEKVALPSPLTTEFKSFVRSFRAL